MLVILHCGQTGVERGACRAAQSAGIMIAGFMPSTQRDEFGPVPADVAEALTACSERGPRGATRANVEIASAVLVVVPEIHRVSRVPAMGTLLQLTRARQLPCLVADGSMSVEDVAAWARNVPKTCGSTRLLVTGPRATRWLDGERVARRCVLALAT